MIKAWDDFAWEDYLYWQTQDKKTLKRINQLLQDIDRNGSPQALFFIRGQVRAYAVFSQIVLHLPLQIHGRHGDHQRLFAVPTSGYVAVRSGFSNGGLLLNEIQPIVVLRQRVF